MDLIIVTKFGRYNSFVPNLLPGTLEIYLGRLLCIGCRLVKDLARVKAFILLPCKTVSLFPFIVQLPVFIVLLQPADRIPHPLQLYT